MPVAETAKLVTELDLRDGLTSGLNKASQGLQRFTGTANMGMSNVKQGAGQLAGGLARVGAIAGGVAVAGLMGAAKAAIDFDDAMAGVRKTMDEQDLLKVGLSFDKLALRFRDMALEIPIAATEFARLGEQAGALGVKAKDIEAFARTTALLGVTTDLTADAAADGLGRLGTILKFTGKDYEEFADIMVNLGNKGASTESQILEISKRFASEGRAAGLAKDQIAALGSATASLGFEPERGGTALSRVFANMSTNIAQANGKGREFARLTGHTIKELQRDLNQGRGLTIFMDVLNAIKGMNAVDAANALKDLGVNNASDRNVFRTMAGNLPFINDQLKIARESTGALNEEAEKRFDTVKSKFQLLKNAGMEAGITLGEGFAPALGRAAERIGKLVKDNRKDLIDFGKDIGKVIDGIDFKAVLDGARTLGGLLKTALDIVSLLPKEVTMVGAGLLGLNKLSGGLFGEGLKNIIGGVAGMGIRGITNKVPGLNKLTATPVFVTNWEGAAFGGGAGGAAGKSGGLLGAVKLLGAVTIAGGSIAALVEQFGTFQATTAAAQADLDAKVKEVPTHTAEQSLEELRGMNKQLSGLNIWDRALADSFGGKQIADGLEAQSHNIVKNNSITGQKLTDAIGVLQEAQKHALARGNQKVADSIGADIATLQRRQTAAQNKTTAAVNATKTAVRTGDSNQTAVLEDIRAKPTNVTVNTTNNVTSTLSVRDAEAAIRTSSRYGFVAT